MRSLGITLLEEIAPAGRSTLRNVSIVGDEVRAHLDDLISERQHPVVVGRHEHHPSPIGEAADEPQNALDLDVVQVSGRFVGENQLRIQGEGTSDRDPLLLATAELVRRCVSRSPSPTFRAARRPVACRTAGHASRTHRHDDVLHAFRLGTRLKAWKTTPTPCRR